MEGNDNKKLSEEEMKTVQGGLTLNNEVRSACLQCDWKSFWKRSEIELPSFEKRHTDATRHTSFEYEYKDRQPSFF